MTQLIEYAGIPRVVIGCPHPAPEIASEGAATLHSAGISVTMGVEQEKCEEMIKSYSELAHTKLQSMARRHLRSQKRVSLFIEN